MQSASAITAGGTTNRLENSRFSVCLHCVYKQKPSPEAAASLHAAPPLFRQERLGHKAFPPPALLSHVVGAGERHCPAGVNKGVPARAI